MESHMVKGCFENREKRIVQKSLQNVSFFSVVIFAEEF